MERRTVRKNKENKRGKKEDEISMRTRGMRWYENEGEKERKKK